MLFGINVVCIREFQVNHSNKLKCYVKTEHVSTFIHFLNTRETFTTRKYPLYFHSISFSQNRMHINTSVYLKISMSLHKKAHAV